MDHAVCFSSSSHFFHQLPLPPLHSAFVALPGRLRQSHPGKHRPRFSAFSAASLSPPLATATAKADDSNAVSSQPNISLPLKKVLVPIAYGTEEMEAIILVDVLRRAGADVTLASVEEQLEVDTSGGMRVIADAFIGSCFGEIYDLVVLPGGMPGSARLRDCEVLQKITTTQAEEKRLYGAICASPAVTLLPWGLIRKRKSTSHPAFMDQLPTFWAVKSDIQVSGELTTSRGPGTTFEFALSLVQQLFDESTSKALRDSLFAGASDDCSKQKEINKVDWSINCTPRVLIPVANGSEELQVAIIVDTLRRAKVEVVIASVEKTLHILASQGTKIVADDLIGRAAESTYDMVILPGDGIVLQRLNKSRVLKKLLKEQESSDRVLGAIFSSPAPVQSQGPDEKKKATPLSSLVDKFRETFVDGVGVVIDGKVITGRGLATATDFALAIVTKLYGISRARSVAEGLVYEYAKK